MKRFGVVLLALALFAISCDRAAKSCAVCQRDECTGLAFRITLENGKSVETCCPRCGLHFIKESRESSFLIQATDYAGGKWMDANSATYVSGSDVSHCAAGEVKHDAQGCCYFKGFDRCMPSVIAFQSQDDARNFAKEHGGTVVAFDQLAAK